MPEQISTEPLAADDHVRRLLDADRAYRGSVSDHYDEVIHEVVARVADSGSVGKFDIAALTSWKRLRADTPWMGKLMGMPDVDVRQRTAEMVAIVNDLALSTPEAAGRGRGALSSLPGFRTGDALASTICFVAVPDRLAVFDRRAATAVRSLGFELDRRQGRYRRFMAIVEECRAALGDAGHCWNARRVDTALYQLGGPAQVEQD